MTTTMTMTTDSQHDAIFAYRVEKLAAEVNNHPHREELLRLMDEQLQDDAGAVM